MQVASDFSGLQALRQNGILSDLVVQLPDGASIPAHRVILAASSDVLSAKFSGGFSDTSQVVFVPEVGSAVAWHFIIDWIYGGRQALPADIVVEVLLVSDYFQIKALCSGIMNQPIDRNLAAELVKQMLEAWAVPEVLRQLSKQVFKLFGSIDQVDMFWDTLVAAPAENAALLIAMLPVICEADRVRVIGWYLSWPAREKERRCWADDPWLDIVHWDAFCAEDLERLTRRDTSTFSELLGFEMPCSQELVSRAYSASIRRCQGLEQNLRGQRNPVIGEQQHSISGYCLPLGGDRMFVRDPPQQIDFGLFAKLYKNPSLKDEQVGRVSVNLSSLHSSCGPEPGVTLFDPRPSDFGTGSAIQNPWIEVVLNGCEIMPKAFGLMHGWSQPNCFCQAFAIEGCRQGSDTQCTLVARRNYSLSDSGDIFPVQCDPNSFFDRFRICMTGPNSSGNHYLMIGWFDVFGALRMRRPESTITKLSNTLVDDQAETLTASSTIP